MTIYNELRDGQEFYGNGYKEGYKDGYKQAILDGKTNFSRPQGEWIEGEKGTIKCDQCGCEIRYSYLIGNKPDFPKFCCDCGAKMRNPQTQKFADNDIASGGLASAT